MKPKYNLTAIIILIVLQVAAAIILSFAGYGKITGLEEYVLTFTGLGMGAFGLNLIGILEILAAILLISWRFSSSGAILGIGIMLGALIAHITELGISDSYLALLVFVMCTIVFVIRRKEAPLIGKSF